MEAEPVKADQPSPRRRFQFRLRTLLIGVTLFAAVAWVVKDRERLVQERDRVIQERDDLLDRLNDFPGLAMEISKQGDTTFVAIPAGTPPEIVARVKRANPDATIKLVPRSSLP